MAEVATQVMTLEAPDGGTRQFRHRGIRADQGVVTQIFQSQDYSLNRLKRGAELVALYHSMVAAGRRPLVIDAGANIGAASVYFNLVFPRVHIVAIEPEARNFALLQANTAGFDVDARLAAIGAADGETALVDPGLGEWGYRTDAAAGGARLQVIGAAALVADQERRGFAPFIAKIDIEGGEAELFARDTGWVERFPLLIVELHDWMLPRGRTSHSFLRCIAGLDRDFVYIGENVFSIANQWTGTGNRA
jgi:FkbM family methyltransferase